MSQSKFVSPLVLEPTTSRYLRIYLFGLHALALCALLLPMPIPLWLRLALISGLAGSAYVSLLRSPPAARVLQRLRWTSAGHWVLHYQDGRQCSATLQAHSYVSRYLVILCLRELQGGERCVALLADQLAEQPFRRLRARLTQIRLIETSAVESESGSR